MRSSKNMSDELNMVKYQIHTKQTVFLTPQALVMNR